MFRKIVEDYEARLHPAAGSSFGGKGKSEHERYGNGVVAFKVKARGLDLPDGAELTVKIAGREIGQLVLTKGRGRFILDSEKGEPVPAAPAVGDHIELFQGTQLVLEGTYRED